MSHLLDETYSLLDATDRSLAEIAAGAGVNFHWLAKFKQRKFSDPGINRVSRLHRYLVATGQPLSSAEAVAQ